MIVKSMSIKKLFRVFAIVSVLCVLIIKMYMNLDQKFLSKAEESTLSYSRSVDSFGNTRANIYVFDNSIYFLENRVGANKALIIKRIKDNHVESVAELPAEVDSDYFFIVNDSTGIVQSNSKIYLFDIRNKKISYLTDGKGVAVNKDYLYYLRKDTLCVMDVFQGNSQDLFAYDEVLASYYDSVIFEYNGNRYIWSITQPEKISSIPYVEINWPVADLWIEEYLYTNDKVFRITKNALDVYTYKTGEVQRIFALNEHDAGGIVVMAVCVSGNDIFISRQCTDIKFWPQIDSKINGTFKYTLDAKTLVKIDQKAYLPIIQFDAKHLYGINHYSLINLDKLVQIQID